MSDNRPEKTIRGHTLDELDVYNRIGLYHLIRLESDEAVDALRAFAANLMAACDAHRILHNRG